MGYPEINSSRPVPKIWGMTYIEIGLIIALLLVAAVAVFRDDIRPSSGPVRPAVLPDQMGCQDQGYLGLVWSLANRPETWRSNGYKLDNGEVNLWIANEEYGLRTNPSGQVGGGVAVPDSCKPYVKLGVDIWASRYAEEATR